MQAPQSRGFVEVDFLLNLKAFNPNNLVMKKLWLLPLLTAALIECWPLQGKQSVRCWPKLPSAGEMTVLAWYGIPSDCTSVERFEELKNAGFTHQFTEYPDAEAMARALDTAERVGIRLIVSCPELKAEPEATVRRFMNHPATAGYFLRDEPSADDFAELGAWAARIRATDDAHYCYLNLFPNYAPCETLKTDSYREYVNRFDREVPLQLLSFDHYPVVGDTCRPEWYENLEIFSDEARKAGKPFWAFALATAHEPYPIPDLAQLRLQVYSDLAYGAQGIQYFTYWTPEKNPTWDFHHAPVERSSGRRTDVYDKIKQMNAEIRALSGVFLGCEVVSVRHTGESIPRGTVRLTELPDGVKKLETTGAGAVVSELRNGNNRFIVIVNRDFKNSMTLQIELDETASRILKDGSVVPASIYHETMVVEPGDAMIYMFK